MASSEFKSVYKIGTTIGDRDIHYFLLAVQKRPLIKSTKKKEMREREVYGK